MKFIDFAWKTDAVIDYWSLVHISWGIILGMVLIAYTRLSLVPSLLISVLLMILWEYFEKHVGIGEGYVNVSSDIIVGIVGFLLGYLLLGDLESHKAILSIVVIIMIILEIAGWYTGYIKS